LSSLLTGDRIILILDPRVKPEGDGIEYWANPGLDPRVKPDDDEVG